MSSYFSYPVSVGEPPVDIQMCYYCLGKTSVSVLLCDNLFDMFVIISLSLHKSQFKTKRQQSKVIQKICLVLKSQGKRNRSHFDFLF